MFILLTVQGCLPYIDLEINENGETITFDAYEEAEKYAKENCAWQYKIVEW